MSRVALNEAGRMPDGRSVWQYEDDEQALFVHEVWCATGWHIADFDLWMSGTDWDGCERARDRLAALRAEFLDVWRRGAGDIELVSMAQCLARAARNVAAAQ